LALDDAHFAIGGTCVARCRKSAQGHRDCHQPDSNELRYCRASLPTSHEFRPRLALLDRIGMIPTAKTSTSILSERVAPLSSTSGAMHPNVDRCLLGEEPERQQKRKQARHHLRYLTCDKSWSRGPDLNRRPSGYEFEYPPHLALHAATLNC